MSSAIEKVVLSVIEKIKAGFKDVEHAPGRTVRRHGDHIDSQARDFHTTDTTTSHDFDLTAPPSSTPVHESGGHGPGGDTKPGTAGDGPSRPEAHGGEPPTSSGDGALAPLPEGAVPLADPSSILSADDHPFLRPWHETPEQQRITDPDQLPDNPHAWLADNPDRRDEPSADDGGELETFTGPVEPYDMEPGRTYYRSVGDGQYANGSFWTDHPVVNDDELRRELAVLNKWNGDHGVVAFQPTQRIRAWHGRAGTQPATGGTLEDGPWLPGGGDQIWVPRGSLGSDDGTWFIFPVGEEGR